MDQLQNPNQFASWLQRYFHINTTNLTACSGDVMPTSHHNAASAYRQHKSLFKRLVDETKSKPEVKLATNTSPRQHEGGEKEKKVKGQKESHPLLHNTRQ